MAAKDIVEKVEKAVEKLAGWVEVELKNAEGKVLEGVHTIFTSKGAIDFVDGKAKVQAEVAQELKDSGQVK